MEGDRDHYLEPCPPSLRGDRGPAATDVEPIRPEIPGDPAAVLPEWSAALGTRPVVYLSLGTVPLVLVPQGADQYINADACERIGVARVVRGETGTSTTVRDAVLAIIRPESLERAAAHRLAAEIEAMPTATQVAQDLRVEAN